jgi:hypothetical protein
MRASSESVLLDILGTMIVEGRNFGGFSPESGAVIPIGTRDLRRPTFCSDRGKLRTDFSLFIAFENLRPHANLFASQISIGFAF